MAVVAADVAVGSIVVVGFAGYCCCHVRTEPVAALQAEACSSRVGHG